MRGGNALLEGGRVRITALYSCFRGREGEVLRRVERPPGWMVRIDGMELFFGEGALECLGAC